MKNEFVRVPFYVERDESKTFFLPKCRAKRGSKVDPKGDERLFSDYWKALECLASMQRPQFQRPNTENEFGIVKCEFGDMEEVRRDYIEAERSTYGG